MCRPNLTLLKINMFMVDYVCMNQSNRKGTLCFCQDDLCNVGRQSALPSFILLLSLSVLLLWTR